MRRAMLFEMAAHPIGGGGADAAAADTASREVGGPPDSLVGVDIDEAVAEAAMQEYRDRGDVLAPMRLLHDVMAAIVLVDIAAFAMRDLVMDAASARIAADHQLDTFRLHGAVLQRAHDLIAAGHHGEAQLAGGTFRLRCRFFCRLARWRFSARGRFFLCGFLCLLLRCHDRSQLSFSQCLVSSRRKSRRRNSSRSVIWKSRALSVEARWLIHCPCGRMKMSLGPQVIVSSPTRDWPSPSTTTQAALLLVR